MKNADTYSVSLFYISVIYRLCAKVSTVLTVITMCSTVERSTKVVLVHLSVYSHIE